MTVAELIKELTEICEGRDMNEIEIKRVVPLTDLYGVEDWEDIYLNSAGGNEYPFLVLIV